jgi:hypothetical protein
MKKNKKLKFISIEALDGQDANGLAVYYVPSLDELFVDGGFVGNGDRIICEGTNGTKPKRGPVSWSIIPKKYAIKIGVL